MAAFGVRRLAAAFNYVMENFTFPRVHRGRIGCMADWPHAPLHRLGPPGAYFITAGTYLKQHYFRNREELLQDLLFDFVKAHSFDLQACPFSRTITTSF